MAITVTNQANPLGARMVQDTNANATAADNTTGASGTLYFVEVDNTNNAGAVYLKIADSANATGGTTAAEVCLACDGSSRSQYVFPRGISFGSGFSHWCVTAPAEASTANPGSAVTVRYITS